MEWDRRDKSQNSRFVVELCALPEYETSNGNGVSVNLVPTWGDQAKSRGMSEGRLPPSSLLVSPHTLSCITSPLLMPFCQALSPAGYGLGEVVPRRRRYDCGYVLVQGGPSAGEDRPEGQRLCVPGDHQKPRQWLWNPPLCQAHAAPVTEARALAECRIISSSKSLPLIRVLFTERKGLGHRLDAWTLSACATQISLHPQLTLPLTGIDSFPRAVTSRTSDKGHGGVPIDERTLKLWNFWSTNMSLHMAHVFHQTPVKRSRPCHSAHAAHPHRHP